MLLSDLVPGQVYHLDIKGEDLVFRHDSLIQGDPDRVQAVCYTSNTKPIKDFRRSKGKGDTTPFVTGRKLRPAEPDEIAWLVACEAANKYVEKPIMVLVCKPGFVRFGKELLNIGGVPADAEITAGHGYEEGRMGVCVDRGGSRRTFDPNSADPYFSFRDGDGVYGKALRPATLEETEAYKNGIRNIKNIVSKNQTVRLHYVDLNGENKVAEANTLDAAMKNAIDLKEINFVINE